MRSHYIDSKDRLLFLRSDAGEIMRLLQSERTPDELGDILDERSEKIQSLMEHADQCEAWLQSEKRKRSLELERLRDARREAFSTNSLAWVWRRRFKLSASTMSLP